MKTFNSCVVLVLVTAFGSGLAASNICQDGTCTCLPAGQPTTINCDCAAANNNNQPLNFNERDLNTITMNEVSKVNISNCNRVTFNTDSFKHLKKLQTLVVNRVRTAVFNRGVFESLNNLHLLRIDNLDFKRGAFMGADVVEEIELRDSAIPQLVSHSLYDIKHLRSLHLTNVTMDVQRDAVHVDMVENDSQVVFEDCVIRSVEENGIIMKTNTFAIRKSTFGVLKPNSINITSTGAILITKSQFNSTLDSNAIHMASPNVTFDSNVFKRLPSDMLANINNRAGWTTVLTNNTVQDLVLGSALGAALQQTQIRDNRFNCTCAFGTILLALLPGDVIDNNFCSAKCNVSLKTFTTLITTSNACSGPGPLDLDAMEKCDDRIPTRAGRTFVTTTDTPISTTPNSTATTNIASTVITISLVTMVLPQLV